MRYNNIRRLIFSLAAILIELLTAYAILPLLLLPPLASSSAAAAAADNNEEQRRRSTQATAKAAAAPLNTFLLLKDHIDLHRPQIENFVFQSLHHFSTTTEQLGEINYSMTTGQPTLPSRMYTYDDFMRTLQTMAVDGMLGNSFHRTTNPYKDNKVMGNNDYVNDESNMAFYISQDHESSTAASSSSSQQQDNNEGMTLAIVNICAFLANAMVESIQFDACDEWNGMMTGFDTTSTTFSGGDKPISLNELSAVNGRYFPSSNACGQNGRSYQGEEDTDAQQDCTINDVDVSCPVDPLMDMRATVHPKYNYIPGKTVSDGFRNQPPPEFACGKKDYEGDYPGYWDGYTAEFVQDVAYPSAGGRIDVEGCCFWGRGALQTKGTCALGKFNYHFGKRAYNENRPARYPNVDFCSIPVSVLINYCDCPVYHRVKE